MSKQIDINDLIPSEIKDSTRRFIDTQFQGMGSMDGLPPVRTRYEGYGLLSEAYQGVKSALESVNAAMRDCLRSLSGNGSNFQDAARNAFNSVLDTTIASVAMGVQSLNVIYKIEDIRMNCPPTPMEEMAAKENEPAEDADELPDVAEDA